MLQDSRQGVAVEGRIEMVSVVIATYNNAALLKECLDSVVCQSYSGLEVIVVFNNTQQHIINGVKSSYPEVASIINSENLLFCKASNQGVCRAKGEYILCLNDDTRLEPDYIEKIVRIADANEKIGMVSGKILRFDRKTIDSTGLFLGLSRKPVERGYNQKDRGQYDTPGYVFGVSGCAAFYRRKMLDDIRDENGYFDERFGMFYEDLDLAWRARRKGWEGYYEPKARAYHFRGASTQACAGTGILSRRYKFVGLSKGLKRGLIRNRHMTISKNSTLGGFLFHLPWIMLYDLRLRLFLLLTYLFGRDRVCKRYAR